MTEMQSAMDVSIFNPAELLIDPLAYVDAGRLYSQEGQVKAPAATANLSPPSQPPV